MKWEDFISSITVSTIIVFMKVGFVVIFIAHSIACWFVLVAKEEADERDTWLYHYGMLDDSDSYIYITSLYWAVSTMTTVGYGDILPKTAMEKMFVIFAILVVCGMFGYAVGSINSVTAMRG